MVSQAGRKAAEHGALRADEGVVTPREDGADVTHDVGDVSLGRLKHEVVVIGHQGVPVDAHTEASGDLSEHVREGGEVLIGVEDRPPLRRCGS